MNAAEPSSFLKRMAILSSALLVVSAVAIFLGLSTGSSGSNPKALWNVLTGGGDIDPMLREIIWRLRAPRVLLAFLVGGALSLGGLVFQALLRNPLAEPYILGISGGAAVGAIIGILMGFSRFPGVSLVAFGGSTATLFLILVISSGQSVQGKDTLLLSGVMVNAFCSSIITFFLSMTQDSRLHNIIFWLMGDLSLADAGQTVTLAFLLAPCFVLIFCLSYKMNLLLAGREMAMSMGVNVRVITLTLLIGTSFMVSTAVCHSGLLGFVGLVTPHLLRLIAGPDHRVLAPACILGGGAFMVLCDLLARWLPEQGEMPAGVFTALIGAPLFIWLLQRSRQ